MRVREGGGSNGGIARRGGVGGDAMDCVLGATEKYSVNLAWNKELPF